MKTKKKRFITNLVTYGVLILLFVILIAIGAAACFVLWFLMKRGTLCRIQGTSVAGAAAHNVGQVAAAFFIVRTPMLLNTYLPALIGVGIIVGCLTGIVTERVLKALKLKPTNGDIQI